MIFCFVPAFQTQPITVDIFDKAIVNSVKNVKKTDPPSCFNENVTIGNSGPVGGEPCAEIASNLFCPGNYYEVVFSSIGTAVPNPIFLRKVGKVPSYKCSRENKVCLDCSIDNTKCKTQFDRSRDFVMLDLSRTKIAKRFTPKIGKVCRCNFIKP